MFNYYFIHIILLIYIYIILFIYNDRKNNKMNNYNDFHISKITNFGTTEEITNKLRYAIEKHLQNSHFNQFKISKIFIIAKSSERFKETCAGILGLDGNVGTADMAILAHLNKLKFGNHHIKFDFTKRKNNE